MSKQTMKLRHRLLIDSLRKAYSAERAAAFAYIGHAGSLSDPAEKSAVQEIERDEWEHRGNLLAILRQYDIPVSRYYEWKYYLIGKVIGCSCHVIGRFMPYFFAGKLESGNVCEYFQMMKYFHSLEISDHDKILYEMGVKEKEHEVYFLEMIREEKWLPLFEKMFSWGIDSSLNNVDLEDDVSLAESDRYCENREESPRG